MATGKPTPVRGLMKSGEKLDKGSKAVKKNGGKMPEKMPTKSDTNKIKKELKDLKPLKNDGPALKKGLDKMAPKKTSYVGNVVKEVKQTVKAVSNAVDKADRKRLESKTGRKIDVKIGKSNIKDQIGQTAGAVLKGTRYSDATGKSTSKKKGK